MKAVMIVQSKVSGSYHEVSEWMQPLEVSIAHQSKAGGVSEDLVYDHVVGCNPRDPVEVSETLRNPPREPVPDETASKDVEEPPVSTDLPAVRLRWVRCFMIMQGVHQSCVGQSLGPDHSSGPDQETSDDSSHAKAKALCS